LFDLSKKIDDGFGFGHLIIIGEVDDLFVSFAMRSDVFAILFGVVFDDV